MKTRKKAPNILTPSFAFTYVGLIGLVIFLLLRPSFDLNADARLNLSPKAAEERLFQLNQEIGIGGDTVELEYMALRFQDIDLFGSLQEQAPAPLRPRQLNRANVPISGWNVFSGQSTSASAFIFDDATFFQNYGVSRAELDNQGTIISFHSHNERGQGFIPITGVFSYETLYSIIENIFGHRTDSYFRAGEEAGLSREMAAVLPSDIELHEDELQPIPENLQPDSAGVLRLEQFASFGEDAVRLELGYDVVEQDGKAGIHVNFFHARFLNDPEAGTDASSADTEANSNEEITIIGLSIQIAGAIFLALLVFGTAIRQIFLGRMEWKRSLFIFVSFTLAQWLVRITFFYPTYYQFIPDSIVSFDLIQQFFISGLVGLYGAFAYIAWESLARELKSGQIPVIDAVWRGHLLKKEVGAGVLTGYGIAGFYFGILGVLFYYFDSMMMQADGNFFGFVSPSTMLPALHVGLNAWLASMLFVIAQVALMYNIVAFLVRSEALRMMGTILITGSSFFITSRFFETDASALQVFFLYLSLGVPLVLAYRYFGIVSAIISWFALLASLKLMPYISAGDSFMQLQAWGILALVLTPFLFGLVAFIYGDSIRSPKDFIPEYEELLNKRLRSEKELAIAKESQFALLPAQPPQIGGLDISGFFVPSHEVGGDFYDFKRITKHGESGPLLAFSIADVSGKAMQSAFNAIFTSGLLLSRMDTDAPDEILTRINPVLCQRTDNQTFITCQTGRLNPRTSVLEWANAGHCPPVLKREGKCRFLEPRHPKYPLGLRKDVVFSIAREQLQPDDLLFFYSDGLPEARNAENKRLDFGFICQHLENLNTAGKSAGHITGEIKAFILNYSNYELTDDTTLICIRIL